MELQYVEVSLSRASVYTSCLNDMVEIRVYGP